MAEVRGRRAKSVSRRSRCPGEVGVRAKSVSRRSRCPGGVGGRAETESGGRRCAGGVGVQGEVGVQAKSVSRRSRWSERHWSTGEADVSKVKLKVDPIVALRYE